MNLLLVAGARPNFMKVAPVVHAIQRHNASFQAVSTVPHSEATPQRARVSPDCGEQRYHQVETSRPESLNQSLTRPSGTLAPIGGEGRGEGDSGAAVQLGNLQGARVRCSEVPISYKLVHTGQHYDAQMSKVFFDELNIPEPDFNLEVGSGSHAAQTAAIMTRFEPVLLNAFSGPPLLLDRGEGRGEESKPDSLHPSSFIFHPSLPDWLVVVGDVNSTMACTLVAAKLGVRVAHLEAGLRSRDRSMPEEVNRLVTDVLADLLLTPSEDASENLRREGVPDHKIRLVGNIMMDSLVANLPKSGEGRTLERLGLKPGAYIYVTLHRPSNVDCRDSLSAICDRLSAISEHFPVVFPIHPRTRARLAEFGLTVGHNGGVRLLDPLGYHDSLALTQHARCVLTDSGGLQEESTFFCTPCLTLRPNTERPVTVTLGSNRLTSVERLASDLDQVLRGPQRTGQVPPLWDGNTADRVVQALLDSLNPAR